MEKPSAMLRLISSSEARAIVIEHGSVLGSNLIHCALEQVMQLVTNCNQAIDIMAPWRLAKDPRQGGVLDSILYDLAESLRIIAILISPVLPRSGRRDF